MVHIAHPQPKDQLRAAAATDSPTAEVLPSQSPRPIYEATELPDLARLSLAPSEDLSRTSAVDNGGGPRHVDQRAGPPSANVYITINANSSTVVVNPGAAAPSSSLSTPPHSPARLRTGFPPPRFPASPATAAMRAARRAPLRVPVSAPPSPIARDMQAAPLAEAASAAPAPPQDAYSTTSPAPGADSPLATVHISLEQQSGVVPQPWNDDFEHIEPAEPRRKKWYVVTAGLMVGIWGSWVDMATFVEGVRGNVHQSFKSRAEAEDYYFYNKEMGRVFLLSP